MSHGRRVWWRGVLVDARTADMLDAACDLVPDVAVRPTQGSFAAGAVAASSGTHDGPGAVDIAAAGLTPDERRRLVVALRTVGFAAWLRTPAQSDWPWHVHAVAVGCPGLPRAAADQVRDYLAGRNGLASKAPDDGPRHAPVVVGRTFEQWRAEQPPPPPVSERRPPEMITVKSQDSDAVYLLGGDVWAGVTDPADLRELMRALKDPGHTATVSARTFANLARGR